MRALGRDDEMLDLAIRGLRSEAGERLSAARRAAIIEGTLGRPAIVPPRKSWLVAGVGAVFTIILGVMFLSGGEINRPLRIQASKAGDEVVFSISNGHRAHRVVKSTDLEDGSGGAVSVHDGRFRDLADSGPVLVFYKVD